MKYFGKKSLSSVLLVVLQVVFWGVVVTAVIGAVMGVFFIAATPAGEPTDTGTILMDFKVLKAEMAFADWNKWSVVPLPVKILLFPYGAAIVIVALVLLRKVMSLLRVFKAETDGGTDTGELVVVIGKFLIVFSLMVFQLSLLGAGLLVLLLGKHLLRQTAG
ncbi:MAG TPA: hypothetical protein ENN69_03930 [Spirochaetia bacterium]|nr:hypothetical protein [Spirochaetia bacterium]